MQYREFGKTGIRISALGFGGMRLPHHMDGNRQVMHHEEGAELIRHALSMGVNYVDSAPYYCNSESETIVGLALQDGWRDKAYISTKLPIDENSSYDNCRALLDQSLTRLNVSAIDFYHLWGINWNAYEQLIENKGPMKVLYQAKAEGIIKHISFSFHDVPESMIRLVDTGIFESVLCQYNLLDMANERGIQYAHDHGLGVVIMGPVGGGRLGAPSPIMQSLIPGGTKSSAEIALRFVLAHPGVSCALSGMENKQMVDENVKIASREAALSPAEKDQVLAAMEEKKKLAGLYCTGCNYCMPCPAKVDIPGNFAIMNMERVYGLTDIARSKYASLVKQSLTATEDQKRMPASACTQCGQCEKKCPQKIKIRQQLQETHTALGI